MLMESIKLSLWFFELLCPAAYCIFSVVLWTIGAAATCENSPTVDKALTVKTDPALNNCSDNCSWIKQELGKGQELISVT